MGSLVRVQYRPPNQPCKVNLAGLFRFIFRLISVPRLIFRSFASMEVFRWPPPVADSGRRKTVRGCASLAAFFVFSPLVRTNGVFRRPPPAADSGRRKTVRGRASPAAFFASSSQNPFKIFCKISQLVDISTLGLNSKIKKFSYSFICGKGYSPPFGGRIAFCLQSAKSFVRFLHHLRLIK